MSRHARVTPLNACFLIIATATAYLITLAPVSARAIERASMEPLHRPGGVPASLASVFFLENNACLNEVLGPIDWYGFDTGLDPTYYVYKCRESRALLSVSSPLRPQIHRP